jgi:hypothetical protein
MLALLSACEGGTALAGDGGDAETGGEAVVCTTEVCIAACVERGFDRGECDRGLCLCFGEEEGDSIGPDAWPDDAVPDADADSPDAADAAEVFPEADLDEGSTDDADAPGTCDSDEDCADGLLCLAPEGEFPETGTTVRTCVPFDGTTFEDGPLVGRTGCSATNLANPDVWGFCDSRALLLHDGDVVRGSVCGPDLVPVYEYPVAENTRVEIYLSRAETSLCMFSLAVYEDSCALRGGSGGYELDEFARPVPLEIGFTAGSRGVFTIQAGRGGEVPPCTGDFTFHIRSTGTF